jgi:predicted nucleic acid-binding protein
VLICDTSGLLAYFDRQEPDHRPVRLAVDGDTGPFVVSPYVLAELDHLLATRRGIKAELAALTELSGGAWELPALEAADVRRARDLIDAYADQQVGLTDASLVVLAGRYRTDRVLTLDRRHFSVLRTAGGGAFSILPG